MFRGKLRCDVVLRRETYVIVLVATVIVMVLVDAAVIVIVDVGATDVQVCWGTGNLLEQKVEAGG